MQCSWAIKLMRAGMDRDYPGWTETSFLCPACHEYHELVSKAKQLQLVPGAAPPAKTHHRPLPPIKANAPEGYCRWHETASPQLEAPCAWETCRTPVHVHKDALGKVKSGREGKGYLIQRCPACHRSNAVHPTYGKAGIRTSKLEGDSPVLQLDMDVIRI